MLLYVEFVILRHILKNIKNILTILIYDVKINFAVKKVSVFGFKF